MNDKISFSPETALGKALRHWWDSLDDDREARAQLRRAHDLTAVVLTPAFQRFRHLMIARGLSEQMNDDRWDRLGVIAGVLSHLKQASDCRLPAAMRGEDKPKVSELRFRRLLESATLDDLFVGLRRTVPLIDATADPNQLANDIWFWSDRVRKQWAYEYPWPEKAG